MIELKESTQVFAKIPPQKRVGKVRSTAIGVGSIAVAFVLLKWYMPPLPTWAFAVLLAFGAYSISGELVRGFFAFLPAVIRDIRAAIKGDS